MFIKDKGKIMDLVKKLKKKLNLIKMTNHHILLTNLSLKQKNFKEAAFTKIQLKKQIMFQFKTLNKIILTTILSTKHVVLQLNQTQ